MPIRMVDDPNQPEENNSGNNNRRGGGGGGGMIAALIPMVMNLIGRNPKLLIPIVLIGGALYFFGGSLFGGKSIANLFGTGATFDQKKYDKREVFEPLSADYRNGTPDAISLLQYAPRRKNQGQQGSCVAWASSYAARTILYARQTGKNPDEVAFSPSFLYNQIALEGCQGSYVAYAMDALQNGGDVPFGDFPYDENDCSTQPSPSLKDKATQFKIKGSNRLTVNGDDYTVDLEAIKQNLAQGAPVVIGMMVGGSFMQGMIGEKVWHPERSDYAMRGFGGHAMCVIGYDDNLEGGAFQIMNSWGIEWGDNGTCYVKYDDFKHFVKEAHGLYPMGASQVTSEFKMDFGLVENDSKQNIELMQKSGNLFETKAPVKKGTKFKIEVTNTFECYTYVFGQETDGSSYVLFPYTQKHSPYCGITGTRLFPRYQSLMADDIGSKDMMAVVVSLKPLDFESINKQINQSRQATYQDKVNEVLRNELVEGVRYTPGKEISFNCKANGKSAVAMIIEVNKN